MKSKLYVYHGKLIDDKYYERYISLLKVLYLLEIIDKKMIMDSVMEFVPFYV